MLQRMALVAAVLLLVEPRAACAITAQKFEIEFESGSDSRAPEMIKGTTFARVTNDAGRLSGRDDPFVSLLLPAGIRIEAVPQTRSTTVRPLQRAHGARSVQGRDAKAQAGVSSAGPTAQFHESQIVASCVLRTVNETMAILEADGGTVEVQVGERLVDGSRVVSISDRTVTLVANGIVRKIEVGASPERPPAGMDSRFFDEY